MNISKKTIQTLFISAFVTSLFSCGPKPQGVNPTVITEKVIHDTDDPAIWVNRENPAESIVFGTDKDNDGAIYAFDLDGKIIEEKTIRGIKRPNNVDIEYDFPLNDSVNVDIMAFSERYREQIRVFSVPEMKPLDGGGFPVFVDEPEGEFRAPMGIATYKSPKDGSVYVIVGRKNGPENGYFHQYKLVPNENNKISAVKVREFGRFSGKKEIEAVAVDDALGFVYYSDEQHCIRKYYAEPAMGNDELACFGGEHFKRDNEGIAVLQKENGEGYVLVSNQSNGSLAIFSRKTNEYIKDVSIGTTETDGIELVDVPLNDTFSSGLLVAMNDEKNFFFYNLDDLELDEEQIPAKNNSK